VLRRIIQFVLSVVIAAMLSGAISGQSSLSLSISGRVWDKDHARPMEGARVYLMTSPPSAYRVGIPPSPYKATTTDAQGRFTFAAEPGRYRVVPSLDGFVFSPPNRFQAPHERGAWVRVSKDEAPLEIELQMNKESLLTGVVLAPDGKPVLDCGIALLRLIYDEYGEQRMRQVVDTITQRPDDRGQFRFSGLQRGDYFIHVTGGGPLRPQPSVYFPGVTESARAIPVHVGTGEEVRVGTITVPNQGTAEVLLRLKNVDAPVAVVRVVIGRESLFTAVSNGAPHQIIVPSVARGQYDVLVSSDFRTDLIYSALRLDVQNSNIDMDAEMKLGLRVSGKVLIESDGKQAVATGVTCILRPEGVVYGIGYSKIGSSCVDGQFIPGRYRIEMSTMPPESYIQSATVAGRDILENGIQLADNADIQILLGTPGGVVQGVVTNSNGERLSQAVIALVPDPPFRSAGPLYRSVISDVTGRFELHGIAPGNYHLFGWSELEGSAYRNAEFMKAFEELGKPVQIQKGSRVTLNVAVP
jgi:hypothetical protein